MYWIDILSRLQLVSFFFFLAGAVLTIPMIGALLSDDETSWKSLTRTMIVALILLLISALVAFFAPSAEYIEYLKGGVCE